MSALLHSACDMCLLHIIFCPAATKLVAKLFACGKGDNLFVYFAICDWNRDTVGRFAFENSKWSDVHF
jgi:hypothetical protein